MQYSFASWNTGCLTNCPCHPKARMAFLALVQFYPLVREGILDILGAMG
jgi:hypothetical protein